MTNTTKPMYAKGDFESGTRVVIQVMETGEPKYLIAVATGTVRMGKTYFVHTNADGKQTRFGFLPDASRKFGIVAFASKRHTTEPISHDKVSRYCLKRKLPAMGSVTPKKAAPKKAAPKKAAPKKVSELTRVHRLTMSKRVTENAELSEILSRVAAILTESGAVAPTTNRNKTRLLKQLNLASMSLGDCKKSSLTNKMIKVLEDATAAVSAL